jgi:hypothetical protein
MPILNLQRQLRQLGRIRTGNQVTSKGGKRIPNKLETFRLTSESRELIVAAAEAFGGNVTPWRNGDHDEFEVVTTTPVIDIVVPPGQAVSQWYEMWSGGGCQRRCDGVTEIQGVDRNGEPGPCLCPGDVEQRIELSKKGAACKATTRLNVILPQLPDLGAWMLESHGYYAAVELAGAAEILAMASARGTLIPARLRLEQREKKVPGKPTNRYAVPIIEFVETRMRDLALTAGVGPGGPALGSGERPARPELPATTLPPTSDLRAPLPPASDGPGGAAEASQLPASTPAPDEAQAPGDEPTDGVWTDVVDDDPQIEGLSAAGFTALRTQAGISQADTAVAARRLFPDAKGLKELTDAQRAQLWAELERAAAVGV